MYRTSFFLLALSVGIAGGQEASPMARFETIVREYAQHRKEYQQKIVNAKDSADQEKLLREGDDQPATFARLLELARAHPKDPVAYQSAAWIVQTAEIRPANVKPYAEAIDLLIGHVENSKNEELLERMAQSPFLATERFLEAMAARGATKAGKGRALYHQALFLKNYCGTVVRLDTTPEFAQAVEIVLGPELTRTLRQTDTASFLARAETLFAKAEAEYPLVAYQRTTLGKAAEAELFELRHLSVGRTAPEIVGEDLDGKPLKLSEFRGKVVALVFWGTWCGHCMAMVPQERALVKRHAQKPFALLGVNSDEDRAKIRPTLAKQGITWPSFWDGGDTGEPIAKRWNVQGWPTVYVLDGKGVIRYRNVRGDRLDRAVDSLLAELEAKK